jgi:hypothetical protein
MNTTATASMNTTSAIVEGSETTASNGATVNLRVERCSTGREEAMGRA